MTKKLLTQILVVLAGFLILPQAMQAEDVTNWSQIVTDYGPATEGDYADDGHLDIEGTDITILSPKGLAWLAKETNKGGEGEFDGFTGYTITLDKDIDLAEETDGASGLQWTPIGDEKNRFKGCFDGNNRTISNLYIDDTDLSYVGLFGYIHTGLVKNLTVVVSDKGIKTTGDRVGVIAGAIAGSSNDYSVIANCQVKTNSGKIEAHTSIGGMIGYSSSYVYVYNSFANIELVSNSEDDSFFAGGINGDINPSNYNENVYAVTKIKNRNMHDSKYVGGLSGTGNNASAFKLSYWLIGEGRPEKAETAGRFGTAKTETEMKARLFRDSLTVNAIHYNQALLKNANRQDHPLAHIWNYNEGSFPTLGTVAPVRILTPEEGAIAVDKAETKDGKIIVTLSVTGDYGISMNGEPLMPVDGVFSFELPDEGADIEITAITPVPSVYHTLTLDVAPAIDLYNLSAGNHTVEEGGHLHLQFLPEDRTATADDILFLVDGVETPFNDFGGGNYFSYILNPVTADHTILVAMHEYTVTLPDTEGVTFDIGAGEHAVPYGERFTFSLTLDEGIDPAAVHVYVNDFEIQPDHLRSVTLSYTIEKVTNPITVRIDGTENPTGNTRLTDTRIYCAGGQLVIETATSQKVQVYSITGSFVASRQVSGRETIGMQPGVYIVRTKEVIQKVVVY